MQRRVHGFRFDTFPLPLDDAGIDREDLVHQHQAAAAAEGSSEEEDGGYAFAVYEDAPGDDWDMLLSNFAHDVFHESTDAWLDARLAEAANAVCLVEFSHTPGRWQRTDDDVDLIYPPPQQQQEQPHQLQQGGNGTELDHGEAVIMMPACLHTASRALIGADATAEVERLRRLRDPIARADRAVHTGS